jgi:hypothetical protein
MGRALTQYIGDLGKSRQATTPKAWHVHGNIRLEARECYPLLAEVGKDRGQQLVLPLSENGSTTFTIGLQLM